MLVYATYVKSTRLLDLNLPPPLDSVRNLQEFGSWATNAQNLPQCQKAQDQPQPMLPPPKAAQTTYWKFVFGLEALKGGGGVVAWGPVNLK